MGAGAEEVGAVSPDDVRKLAALVRLGLPTGDADALAPALAGLLEFLRPLLDPELPDADPLVHDPRWR